MKWCQKEACVLKYSILLYMCIEMVLVNQQCKWWCQKCLIMVARLHLDFQPVVELDLKDNRPLHFLPFERTGPNSR